MANEIPKAAKCFPGDRFGRWTVVKYSRKDAYWKRYYECRCECGKTMEVIERCLMDGTSKSCGCLRTEMLTKHGYSSATGPKLEYRIYNGMKGRCNDTNRNCFDRYGGAGVKICDRWMESFSNFIADMGPCPKGKCSIDRIDGSKGYEPENCKWASTAEQARNKKSNVMVTFRGETKCLQDWAAELGIHRNTLDYRLRKWGDPEKAFTSIVRHELYGKKPKS